MKQFTAALIACVGAVSAYGSSYGSTGHYNNAYGHGGRQDHGTMDHNYGYDSIPTQKWLQANGGGNGQNLLKETSALTAVAQANTDRINGLIKEKDKHIARLNEIDATREIEIAAPFDYQISLLNKELADVSDAFAESSLDLGLAQADMLLRLDNLYDDKVAGLRDEITQIKNALARAAVDRKDPCLVLHAIRASIAKNIACPVNIVGLADNSGTNGIAYNGDDFYFREYEGLFDDFHYDIGHGKGLGEDSRKGYHNDPVGDYETDTGAATRAYGAGSGAATQSYGRY